MSNIAIKVESLSKQYRLGDIGTGSLAHDINRWWHTIRGNEDPYLKIGEANDRTRSGSSQYVWSLRDVGFEIQQGDAVGIIGRNGAGKSTLLKILSRVTAPTTGSIKVKGRIASLLEVGTGFHPDLTGRENIFLNGAILGMRKHEIKKHFDAIVDFAGVERYVDTPVKRYSSGMYVRLAFAVAAYLESEVLIVDEVLAVGDGEFQKKCLGKMGEVSKGEGRTVLFVSHNMSSILSLTQKCIYLANGQLVSDGATSDIVDLYLSNNNFVKDVIYTAEPKETIPNIVKASVVTKGKNSTHICGEDISFKFSLHMPYETTGMCLSFQIFDLKERAYVYNWLFDSEHNFARGKGIHELECSIPNFKLYKGRYSITVHLAEQKGKTYFGNIENICPFEVEMKENHEWGWPEEACAMLTDCKWLIKSE
jgi:lipopolysaccharide transport system ATP-binding protein